MLGERDINKATQVAKSGVLANFGSINENGKVAFEITVVVCKPVCKTRWSGSKWFGARGRVGNGILITVAHRESRNLIGRTSHT